MFGAPQNRKKCITLEGIIIQVNVLQRCGANPEDQEFWEQVCDTLLKNFGSIATAGLTLTPTKEIQPRWWSDALIPTEYLNGHLER